MESRVVFADFRRSAPLVRKIDGLEFCVLLNADDDGIRLRSLWNPTEDPANVVLNLSRPSKDEWSVQLHPQSPSLIKPMMVDIESSMFTRSESWDLSRRHFRCGDIFRFVLGWETLEKGFQMTVFDGDLRDRIEIVEDDHVFDGDLPNSVDLMVKGDCGGRLKPLELMKLPKEVLLMIISRLPWVTVVYTLPFVSTEMFRVLKGIVAFPILDLGRPPDFCQPDVEEFCSQVRENCNLLRLGCIERFATENNAVFAQEVPLFHAVVQPKWSALKELHLVDQVMKYGGVAQHFQHALNECNFPVLEVLVVLPSGPSVFGWRHLLGAKLPKLKSLSLHVDDQEAPIISHRFLLLEKLYVKGSRMRGCILPRVPEDWTEGVEGLFPSLKELKIWADPSSLNPVTFEATFGSCRRAPIEKLHLEWLSMNGYLNLGLRIQAGVFFGLFPLLKDLALCDSYKLEFRESIFVDLCLGQLRVLKLNFDDFMSERCDRLQALEEAEIDSRHELFLLFGIGVNEQQMQAKANTRAKILRLPKLRVLKLNGSMGSVPLESFKKMDQAVVSVAEVLEIELNWLPLSRRDNFVDIQSVLMRFPNVRQVVFKKSDFNPREARELLRVVGEALPSIGSLVLRDVRKDPKVSLLPKIVKLWPRLIPPFTRSCYEPLQLTFFTD